MDPFVRINRFLEADAHGALQEQQRFTPDGAPLDEASADRVTWIGFQSHASFPEEQTTIGEERIELPAGAFECWRYTVRDGASVSDFWFAKELPGMPVRMEQRDAGALVFRMVMLENVPGATLAG